jgi:hypothetical protein
MKFNFTLFYTFIVNYQYYFYNILKVIVLTVKSLLIEHLCIFIYKNK